MIWETGKPMGTTLFIPFISTYIPLAANDSNWEKK